MKKIFCFFFLSSVFLFSQNHLVDERQIILLGGKRVGTTRILTNRDDEGLYSTEYYQEMTVTRGQEEFFISQRDIWVEDSAFKSLVSEICMNREAIRISAHAMPEGIRIVYEGKNGRTETFIKNKNNSSRVLGPYLAASELKRAVTEKLNSVSYSILSPETMSIEKVTVSVSGSGELEDSCGQIHRGILLEERYESLPDNVSFLVCNQQGEMLYSKVKLGLTLEHISVVRDKNGAYGYGEAGSVSEGSVPTDFPLLDMSAFRILVKGPDRPRRLSGRAAFRFKGTGVKVLERAVSAAFDDLGGEGYKIRKQGDFLIVEISRSQNIPEQSIDRLMIRPGSRMYNYIADGFHLNLDDPRLKNLVSRCNTLTLSCLQDSVYTYIVNKNAGWSFASTIEILDSHAGDCTEHSILLISLLRMHSVPCRMAYGFVLAGNEFIGHAWVEIYALGRWFWIDPSFPDKNHHALKIRMGVLDPAYPVWSQIDLALMQVAGGVTAEIMEREE